MNTDILSHYRRIWAHHMETYGATIIKRSKEAKRGWKTRRTNAGK